MIYVNVYLTKDYYRKSLSNKRKLQYINYQLCIFLIMFLNMFLQSSYVYFCYFIRSLYAD